MHRTKDKLLDSTPPRNLFVRVRVGANEPPTRGLLILIPSQRRYQNRMPVRRNQKPLSSSSDAPSWDNHPFLFTPRHAGRTALCPEMSVAPAAVHNPSAMVLLSLVGGDPLFVQFDDVNFVVRV
jgi:hypothetical protein